MKTILVAEDIDSNYLLLHTILRNDYCLFHAQNGQEAIELLQQLDPKPDLILMDIKMPVMDGIEATTKIRKMNFRMPIIALTAYAYNADKMVAIAAGCNDYLSKPISVAALREMVRKWIDL